MDDAVSLAVIGKKLLAMLASNKQGRRFLGTVAGIVIFIVLLPVIALVGFFGWMSGGGEMFLNGEQIIAALPAAQQEEIRKADAVYNNILDAFAQAGLPKSDAEKAQLIYLGCLLDKGKDKRFIENYLRCFQHVTERASLYDNLSNRFSVRFTEKDIQYLDEKYGVTKPSAKPDNPEIDFIRPHEKNSADLVLWAKFAHQSAWGYVYGTYGTVLDEALLQSKAAQFPDEVGGREEFIRENWLGKRTADCVGLIKGYGWYNAETGAMELGANGMPDLGADAMYENAAEKGPVAAMPETPGLAVWHKGHIGIYIGGGEVVQAASTEAGVIKTRLAGGGWTHWLKIPYITYG